MSAHDPKWTLAASWKSGRKFDFDLIRLHQALSLQMQAMINDWVAKIDQRLRSTAGSRMPSEWAKKVQCWEAMRDVALDVPEARPPEMYGRTAEGTAAA